MGPLDMDTEARFNMRHLLDIDELGSSITDGAIFGIIAAIIVSFMFILWLCKCRFLIYGQRHEGQNRTVTFPMMTTDFHGTSGTSPPQPAGNYSMGLNYPPPQQGYQTAQSTYLPGQQTYPPPQQTYPPPQQAYPPPAGAGYTPNSCSPPRTPTMGSPPTRQ